MGNDARTDRGGPSPTGVRPVPMTPIRVTASGLSAARGGTMVAGPVDFALRGGEALVVTGENGAGKSTLLRTLAGLLPVASGRITIEGALAADGEPARTLGEVSHYLGHRNAMKPAVTVGENLRFWQDFLGRDGLDGEAALEALGLVGVAHLPFGYLSAGQQRRASLARLLAVHRPVWLLDEPTGALDAASQARFGEAMARHLDHGGIVIAATHQPLGLEDAWELHLERRVPGTGGSPGLAGMAAAELDAAEGWL